jgi:DNA-binding MarR family transcriptional regulator
MTVQEKSPLEPALAFLRELWALDHALGSASRRMHDRMGITGEQRMVLRFVGKFPGMTAVELASILHVEKSTLSFALKGLEKKGLVSRSRDTTDARKSHVTLTKEGRKLDRPTVGTVERAVDRALQATKPRDIDAVRLFLQRLVHLLEDGSSERGT